MPDDHEHPAIPVKATPTSKILIGRQRRLNEKNEALLAAMDRIESLANRDDLTGLPNRRSITGWLGEMAICRRIGPPLCVAILDLDHFKRINDAYGHLIGDRALQLFSKEALGAIRETDRLGRFGGEEFLLVLTGTELRNASEPLERVRERIELADWTIIDQGFRLTLTMGATEYLRGESVESLLVAVFGAVVVLLVYRMIVART